jgi:hypothetical protein
MASATESRPDRLQATIAADQSFRLSPGLQSSHTRQASWSSVEKKVACSPVSSVRPQRAQQTSSCATSRWVRSTMSTSKVVSGPVSARYWGRTDR